MPKKADSVFLYKVRRRCGLRRAKSQQPPRNGTFASPASYDTGDANWQQGTSVAPECWLHSERLTRSEIERLQEEGREASDYFDEVFGAKKARA
jgi:hypothetical protein